MSLPRKYAWRAGIEHLRSNLRGWLIVAAICLPFAALSLLGYFEFVHSRDTVAMAPAKVTRLLSVPVPGDYGSASTPWLAEVEFAQNERAIAEFSFLPEIGSMVCIGTFRSPVRGSNHVAIGYVDVIAQAGKNCALANQ